MSVCEALYNMRKEHQELIHHIMIYPLFVTSREISYYMWWTQLEIFHIVKRFHFLPRKWHSECIHSPSMRPYYAVCVSLFSMLDTQVYPLCNQHRDIELQEMKQLGISNVNKVFHVFVQKMVQRVHIFTIEETILHRVWKSFFNMR